MAFFLGDLSLFFSLEIVFFLDVFHAAFVEFGSNELVFDVTEDGELLLRFCGVLDVELDELENRLIHALIDNQIQFIITRMRDLTLSFAHCFRIH